MSTNLTAVIKGHENILDNNNFRKRFDDVLNKNSAAFVASVLNMIKNDAKLQECDPMTIWNAALTAATMNLSVDPNMGHAYIIPYNTREKGADGKDKWVKKAQFQMGYKGYKELARRSGAYKFLNVTDVRAGEIKRRNRLTGEMEFEFIEDDAVREAAEIIGYLSYIEYKDGTSYMCYMTVPELKAHAARYSKTYQNDLKNGTKSSKWSDEESFGRMCEKTVTKLNLSRNGVLSVENHLLEALNKDGAVINDFDSGDMHYIDNEADEQAEDSDQKLADINAQLSSMESPEPPDDADSSSSEAPPAEGEGGEVA